MRDPQKWRSPWEAAGVVTGSLLIFAFGVFAYVGWTLASTMFGDLFFSLAFSVFPLVIGFPTFLAVGFLLRLIAEGLLRRRLAGRRYVPWLLPAVMGLGCVAGSFFLGRSPRSLFHFFLDMDPPASVSNFQYWWTTVPGDALYVLRFDLAPSEFGKLLANHPFVEDANPQEIGQELSDDLRPGLPGMDIRPPSAPLVVMYKWSSEDPPGLPHIIVVFATANRQQVVISGDN